MIKFRKINVINIENSRKSIIHRNIQKIKQEKKHFESLLINRHDDNHIIRKSLLSEISILKIKTQVSKLSFKKENNLVLEETHRIICEKLQKDHQIQIFKLQEKMQNYAALIVSNTELLDRTVLTQLENISGSMNFRDFNNNSLLNNTLEKNYVILI